MQSKVNSVYNFALLAMKIFGFEIKRAIPYVDATKGFISTFFNNPVGRTPVTEKTVLGISAYYAGVRRISESIAQLPLEVVRVDGDVKTQINHPSQYLLNKEANYKTISFDFIQILVTSAINWGNGIAIIERDARGNPTSLVNVLTKKCHPVDYDGELWWKVETTDKDKGIIVSDKDVINLRGFGTSDVLGLSAIEYHRQNLGLTIAAQDYGADFYNKGTRIDGYIEYQGKLDPATKQSIREQWDANYGANGMGGTAILDNGTKYSRLGLPPEDAQFIETRKFQKNEIATILGIPPHFINELEHATFSNIEHQNIEYVTYGLGGWIEKLEQEYGRKLLRESEKNNHYFRHNVNKFLRADIQTRAEYYRLMTDIGVFSINEVRALEELNPVADGDLRFVQLNRIELSTAKQYYERDNETNGTEGD